MELGRFSQIDVDDLDIETLYAKGSVDLLEDNLPTNSYHNLISLADPQKTALVRHKQNGTFVRLQSKRPQCQGIGPKDARQAGFLDSLLVPEILVSVGLGAAGTGKTTLALAYALQQYEKQKRNIFLTKPASFVGSAKAFGPVPGDAKEKYAPFLDSYMIVLKKILGEKSGPYLDLMVRQEELRFIPVEYARGCTFENCTFIIDEAQNLTWHELNTLVSRVGDNSKLIVLGDLNQIDIKVPATQTGLYQFANSKHFRSSPICSVSHLTHQYRSRITELVTEIDRELRER